MNKLPRAAFVTMAVASVGLTLMRLARTWSQDSHLEHVAGAWVALAVDLAHGVFYRAAYGLHGYGGTRFFPLYFSLQAAGIRLCGTWRTPGYFLSFASFLLLLAGCYVLLRRLGVDRWLAAAGVLTVLVASSGQDSLLTIREDGMAAMFNIWAVAVSCLLPGSRRRIYLTALLFTLAFATKESSVFGLVAVALWLILHEQGPAALRLLVSTALGYGMVLGAIQLGSSGRALQMFRATMTSGVDAHGVLVSPGTLLEILPGYWAEIIFVSLAMAALVARPLGKLRALPALLFICTLAVTLVILSSPGAAGNHLLDLHVAAVVLFITSVADWSPEFGLGACTAAALMAFISFLPVYRDVDSVPLRSEYQEIADTIGATENPILADNPLIPIVAGQQPYVTDAFMFRIMAQKKPSLAGPLWDMIDHRQFAAVVLQDNPNTDDGRLTYTQFHFGSQFLDHLRTNYEPAGTPGDHYLYLPRP